MPDYSYDHLHFLSPDPVKSARFYETSFGAVIRGTRTLADGRTNVELDLGGLRFMLIDRRTPQEDGLNRSPADTPFGHICLRTDDIDGAVAALEADGVVVSRIKSPRPGVKVVFLRGPDDVIIELSQRDT